MPSLVEGIVVQGLRLGSEHSESTRSLVTSL
jgi:hypothetical protein